MSFHEVFVWTLLRSVAAAALAVPMSALLARLVRQATGRSRFWWLLLVLCPLVAPDLIVGYGYRSFELSLLHRPSLNHCFYFSLVLMKFLPAAAVMRICSPPDPLSKSALHCARLARAGKLDRFPFWKMEFRSRMLRHLPVFGIVFLLTMQEFEIASLLQIPAWSVFLFDAQAGGLDTHVTLRLLVLPVVVQAAVLVPLVWLGISKSREIVPRWRKADVSSHGAIWPGLLIASVAALMIWVLPMIVVSRSGMAGIGGVLRNEILLRSTMLDLVAAVAMAAPCALLSLILALKIARGFSNRESTRSSLMSRLQPVLLSVLVVPGLFGSLAASLVVLALVQQPQLTELRATVWPMALAMVVFLVTRAFVLMLMLPAFGDSESSHLARLLEASPDSKRIRNAAKLKWYFECRPLFLVTALLFYWSLANLTTAALLCPPTIPLLSFDGNIVPLPVRLYKFIHQGRTATLSVMALLSVVISLLLIVVVARVAPAVYLRISTSTTRRS